MKKTLLTLAVLVFSISVFAQVTEKEDVLKAQKNDTTLGWKKGGTINLTLGQVSLNNWAAGGQNSISFNGLLNVFANRVYKNASWDNTLDIGYGTLKQGSRHAPYRKSDDKVEFMSKYGQKASKHWFYAALIDLKTQMTPGYNPPNDSTKISNFLAPAYALAAIGMDYKPNKDFTCFLAPVTAQIIIVNNTDLANAGAFGVDKAVLDDSNNIITPGKKTKMQFGGYVRAAYRKDIMKNINLATELDLFSDYLKNPQNIVVNWQMLLTMKVNKYIAATLSTLLIYDDKVMIKFANSEGPRTQFKEIFGAGFSYKF
jgi:hypothetical protein